MRSGIGVNGKFRAASSSSSMLIAQAPLHVAKRLTRDAVTELSAADGDTEVGGGRHVDTEAVAQLSPGEIDVHVDAPCSRVHCEGGRSADNSKSAYLLVMKGDMPFDRYGDLVAVEHIL